MRNSKALSKPQGAHLISPLCGSMTRRLGRRGFTLVELLVVIGITAVLISVLLPALSRAREQANSVKCLSNLRSMHQAATMHANDHQGFIPAAGDLTQDGLGVDSTPQGLRDPQMKRYLYFRSDAPARLMQLPAALAIYMGRKPQFYDQLGMSQFLDRMDVRQLFLCPSQDPASMPPASTVVDGGSEDAARLYLSYVFNGAFLGRAVNFYGTAPAGQLSRVHHPSRVFLFADGRPFANLYAVMDGYGPDETFLDHLWLHGSTQQLDMGRHRGRINVVFIDGHAESFRLPVPTPVGDPQNPGELDQIGISNGIYN